MALEVPLRRQEKLMAMGGYPEVSLAAAREAHAEGRRLLVAGIDPMAQRKAAKAAEQEQNETSFEAIAARWMEHWKDDKSPRHLAETRRRLDANILPSLGALQVAEIQAPAVVAMVRAVEARGVERVEGFAKLRLYLSRILMDTSGNQVHMF